MGHGLTKLERLTELKRRYIQRAWTDQELAELLGTRRETIYRDRKELETEYPFLEVERGRWRIDRTKLISEIKVGLHEALMLYLAARKASRQTHYRNPHTANAVEKLAAVLYPPMAEKLLKAADAVLQQAEAPQRIKVLETLAQGWVTQHKVRIRYHPFGYDGFSNHVIHPYLFEPSIWSDSIYVIAYSEVRERIISFKVERVDSAFLSGETFEMPADFDEQELLKHAWGIWHGEKPPQTVRLRFNKQAAQRLRESKWHPRQSVTDTGDGGCIWEAPIADWREMLPWVRGWGADVEVLGPKGLRRRLEREVKKMAQVYGGGDTKDPKYMAHTRNEDGKRHDLVEHLQSVAHQAEQFAIPLHARELAYYLGLWHDLGKFHPDFQQYLLDAEAGKKRRGPDHKAAGVRLALEHRLDPLMLVLQGHHGGLQDFSNLHRWYEQRKSKTNEALSLAKAELDFAPLESLTFPDFVRRDAPRSAEFFLRMVFSALVDADFLDTESHFNPEKTAQRGSEVDMSVLWERFLKNQQVLLANPKSGDTKVNRIRREIYDACLEAAAQSPGFFWLTVPTGGGKTRSGMAFALRHAQEHNLRRIVVVVPYITITQQTAQTYRDIFEQPDEDTLVVLEHHSSVIEPEDEEERYNPKIIRQRLASENWDAPIIVTTTVQFFESIFANSTSRCRKLHRLAQSVIILDEAQSLPVHLLDPMLDALRELCTHYGSTVVLSTATQPDFEVYRPFRELPTREIVPQPERYFQDLKRVEYTWRVDTPLSWETVANLMRAETQALAICNTKRDALNLFAALDDANALHLSTLLCGKHRTKVIEEIKERLRAGAPCRVVATQVVEAGVDVDFPLVLRAIGPLDSLMQAAGRANREGTLKHNGKPVPGRVIIFKPADGGLPPGTYERAAQTTLAMLRAGRLDMHDPNVTRQYFRKLYQTEDDEAIRGKRIQEERSRFDYIAVAKDFKMITDDTVNVVITTYGSESEQKEVQAILERLHAGAPLTRKTARKLQPYVVTVPRYKLNKYFEQGFLFPNDPEGLAPDLWEWIGKYDPICGLSEVGLSVEEYIR